MTFAEKLLQLRKKAGLSQEELAGRLGVSRQAVSRWELGTALPDVPNLLQISDLFGVTADYLIRDGQGTEQAAPAAKPEERRIRREHSRQTILAGMVGLHAIAFVWEWMGWSVYEPGWPFWVGIMLAVLDVLLFELWLRCRAGAEAAQTQSDRRQYYRRSVWLFGFFPIQMLWNAVSWLYPRPYPALVGRALSLALYALACAAITWALRDKKDRE